MIIGSYGAVALHITGIDRDGHITNASGLVLDPGHILTNAHVVRDTTVDTAIPSPTQQPPAIEGDKTGPHIKLRVKDALVHETVDIAVIPTDTTGERVEALGGVAFRDPEWSDETYIFGYRRYQRSMPLTLLCSGARL